MSIEQIIGYLGLGCLLVVVFWEQIEWFRRKKDGSYKEVKKDPWWKETYFWQVFFRRASYRLCASSFPYVIFIVPASIMVFGYMSIFYAWAMNGKAKKLDEMNVISGVVTKIHVGRGKNSYDYILVKDNKGVIEEYEVIPRFFSNKEKGYDEAQEFKKTIQDMNKKITIWYEHQKWLFHNENILRELKVDNQFIILNNKIKFKYDYEWFKNRDKNALPNLLWWLIYSIPGWLWLWWLNKNELPIHRLNRRKYYRKYNLKDK